MVLRQDRLNEAIAAAVGARERLWSGPVEYTLLEERNNVAAFGLELGPSDSLDERLVAHLAQHHRELMFVKARDWRDEREYRWVYLASPNESEVLVPLECCLEEIILGHQCDSANVAEIQAACPTGIEPTIRKMVFSFGKWTEPALVSG